jgi:hypothetical protein
MRLRDVPPVTGEDGFAARIHAILRANRLLSLAAGKAAGCDQWQASELGLAEIAERPRTPPPLR